jgi:hypothetical protein
LLNQLHSHLTGLEVSSTKKPASNTHHSCFIYAIKKSNQISDDLINKMSSRASGKFLTIRYITRLADESDLNVKVVYYSTRQSGAIINRLSNSRTKQILMSLEIPLLYWRISTILWC